MLIDIRDLVTYTDWERQGWHRWLQGHGDAILQTTAGANGDGRFSTIGDLIRHIFSAEKRYVERLSDQSLTDTNAIPNDSIERLFAFGQQSRQDMLAFLETFPRASWDIEHLLKILSFEIKATPRKVLVHVLIHEIRHWAQIATLFRLNDYAVEFRDFLFSPAMLVPTI